MNAIIKKTTDYSFFKNLSYNRKNGINRSKINEIIDSISQNNYLHLHPIIVDESFNVIDGQHRLYAAKKLGVPIYYIQESNISEQHVMNANTAQSSWSVEDVINFYAVKDRKVDYMRLQRIMNELKLKPKGVFGLLFGVCNKSLLETIKKGFFKFPENDNCINLVIENFKIFKNFAEERRIKPISMFSNANFTQAFRMLCLNKSFDMDIFINKLENKWFEITPKRTANEYFDILIKIYNWHNRDKRIDETFTC